MDFHIMGRVLLGIILTFLAALSAWGLTVEQINPQPEVPWYLILPFSGMTFVLFIFCAFFWRQWQVAKSASQYSQQVINQVPDTLIEIDRQGKICRVNHSLYRGVTIDNLEGRLVSDLLTEPQTEVFQHHLDLAFDENIRRSYRQEVKIDGRQAHLQSRIVPINVRPGQERALMVITDITSFKDAERTLEAARQQAENQAQVSASFLANMSHELRTPLSGIVGMVSLIEDTYSSDEMRQYTQPLLSSVDHLRRIVDDVLELAKADSGKILLEETDIGLWQILDDLEGLFVQQAQQKGIQFEIELHSSVPRYLRIDGFRLRQVLYNLVGNAVKFTNEGIIRLEISVSRLAHRSFLRFAVIDSGVGLEEQQAAHIFEAYEQAGANTAHQHGGTGLGLSICKKLVELMGGVIDVQSEPRKGSTFWFTIPLHALQEPEDWSYWRQRGVSLAIEDQSHRTWFERFFSGLKIPIKESDSLLVTDHVKDDSVDWTWWLGQDTGHEASNVLSIRSPWRRMILADRLLNDLVPREGKDMDINADSASGQSILVVEDNPTNELVIRRMLEKMGMQVNTAINGKEGVEAWRAGQYDIILMDIQMPIMNGIDAARSIRQQETSGYTPIIALTANAQKSIEEECFTAGMDAFLTKPVDRSQLQNTLQMVLGGHKVTRSAG